MKRPRTLLIAGCCASRASSVKLRSKWRWRGGGANGRWKKVHISIYSDCGYYIPPTVALIGEYMKYWIIFIASLFLIVSCGKPNFDAMALQPQLYRSGDLPDFIKPGESKNELWPSLERVLTPSPAKAVYQ